MLPNLRSPGSPSRRRLRAALSLWACLSCALSLAACQTDEKPALKVEVPVLINRPAPPDLVAQCPRLPPKPAGGFPQTAEGLKLFVTWTQKALYAGSACRALSDRQGQWIGEPPT